MTCSTKNANEFKNENNVINKKNIKEGKAMNKKAEGERKYEWKIVEDFVHECIRCLIAKKQIGDRENSRASLGEDGFYQYNGYVVIPKGHRDYRVVDTYEYEFLKGHLINKKDIKRYKKGEPTGYDVHGGITFRNWGQKGTIYPEGEWLIGFDTAHLGDFEDISSFIRGWKKGIDYVRNETKRLAEQVARVGEGNKHGK